MSANSSKKAKVLAAQKKKKRTTNILLSVAAASVLFVAVFLFARSELGDKPVSGQITDTPTFNGTPRSSSKNAGHAEVTPVNGVISVDAKTLAGGEAFYFSTKAAGKTVNFFVLESSDGVVRAAFDACDVCFRAKRGYSQAGDIMVCNNCGQRFPSNLINVEKGGCNPSPLERHMEDGHVIINIADVEKGAMYF